MLGPGLPSPLRDVLSPGISRGHCEGDCDQDSDCTGSMRCFQRDGNEFPVPKYTDKVQVQQMLAWAADSAGNEYGFG